MHVKNPSFAAGTASYQPLRAACLDQRQFLPVKTRKAAGNAPAAMELRG
jgi:hypothetical protein